MFFRMLLRFWFPIGLSILFLLFLPTFVLFTTDLLGYSGPVNAWLEEHVGLSHHSPLTPWASLILFLVPIGILLLYFLRLKRKPLTVPSTFLWKKSIEDLHVNRLLQWLRNNVLLLLQLLAILAAIYAVLAPRLHGTVSVGKHYILMIDNSASMSATDVKPSRLAWAKAEALKEIDAASDSDFGMVVVFNSSAEIRQSYTSNRDLLRLAIAGIEPTNHPTNIQEALSLAESLANPLHSTENEAARPMNVEPGKERTYAAAEGIQSDIHLYSDGRFADQPNFALSNLLLNFHSPAAPSLGNNDNIGIVRFDAVRDETDPSRLQAFVKILNYRGKEANVSVDLNVMANGRVVDVRQRPAAIPARTYQAPLPDDNSPTNVERDLPGEVSVKFDLSKIDENTDISLHVKLRNHTDAFSQDDQAWLVLGIVRKAKVLLVTSGNPLLDIFFQAKSTQLVADVTTIAPAAMTDSKIYLDPIRDGKFDLVVYDRCGPKTEEEMPRANTFFIGSPPPPWHIGGAADEYRIETVPLPQVRGWADSHPVMRGLRGWHELEVAEAYRFKNLPPRTPRLVEAAGDLNLLFPLQRQAYTDLVLAFPLSSDDAKWNTRWFLKPLFPLFLRNLLYSLGNVKDNATEESVRPGNPKNLIPSENVTEITIRNPSDTPTKLDRGARSIFTFAGTGELGIYDVAAGKERRRFAVNLFDEEESNIDPRASVRIGSTEIEAGATRKQPRELWRYAVLLAFVVLLLEWWIYNRRVRV